MLLVGDVYGILCFFYTDIPLIFEPIKLRGIHTNTHLAYLDNPYSSHVSKYIQVITDIHVVDNGLIFTSSFSNHINTLVLEKLKEL